MGLLVGAAGRGAVDRVVGRGLLIVVGRALVAAPFAVRSVRPRACCVEDDSGGLVMRKKLSPVALLSPGGVPPVPPLCRPGLCRRRSWSSLRWMTPWCRLQRRARLRVSVGPPLVWGWMWWASHHRRGIASGNTHRPSRRWSAGVVGGWRGVLRCGMRRWPSAAVRIHVQVAGEQSHSRGVTQSGAGEVGGVLDQSIGPAWAGPGSRWPAKRPGNEVSLTSMTMLMSLVGWFGRCGGALCRC